MNGTTADTKKNMRILTQTNIALDAMHDAYDLIMASEQFVSTDAFRLLLEAQEKLQGLQAQLRLDRQQAAAK